ncbi:hypothetical protein AU193_10480 [Mycobacterium sp. GA-1285]|uniref:hypothetical protein n=1 Tax=Mycobacterium sp. GA-1285 TaxID=1772282 RepID=UPI00074A22E1|nr:hypothetical protein [Mycobacterium sp. GA-1285]KUI22723.1 hypothetical protein AU193_10480 [Mycobacterium sp. GA-1285]
MATLHSVLALYGALDDAVVALDDPNVTETVEAFLPGTTGPGRQGWFGDIRRFVRELSVDPDQTEFPSRTAALREFGEMRSDTEVQEDVGIEPVEMARLLYVIGAHWQLTGRAEEERELFANALSVAVPGPTGLESDSGGQALLDLFGGDLQGQESFLEVIERAANEGLVSEELLLYVRSASYKYGIRRDACGEYAVLKVRYFRDGLTVDKVKKVVDPLNWDNCCPFFCDMKPIPKTPDSYGWSRVLESISTLCGVVPGYRIRTAIKYWKGEKDDGAFVNYDIDDGRANTTDDGFTVLDRGYISFEKEERGVRITTLKEVKFAGVPPLATLMFALIGGYAAIGEHMLVDCALNPPPGLVGWKVSVPTGKPAKPIDPTVCASAAAPAPCGCQQSFPPAVAEAVDLWASCVTEVSTEYAELVNHWAQCGFDPTEMAEFGAKVSARMATDPWRIFGLMLGESPQHKGH